MNPTRNKATWLPLAAVLLALLSAAACDTSQELSEGERRVVVGSVTPNLCPFPDADSTVNVQATVYGLDGSVAPGVAVTMTTTDGVFPNGTQTETVKTGEAGIVNLVVTTRRPPDDLILVTGTLPDGKQDSVEIKAPPSPRVALFTQAPSVAVGEEITIIVPVSGLCFVSQALFDISYDPAVVSFDTTAEGGIFNNVDNGGAMTPADLYVVDAPRGNMRINYARTDRPQTGVTISGTLLGIRFTAIAPGLPKIYIRDVSMLPVDGRPYPTDNGTDSPDSLPITVTPATPAAVR